MAFATSNVQLGSNGDSWSLSGKWSGNAGDASGTVTVGGAFITSVSFYNTDATSQEDRPTPVDVSTNTSTGKSTITVHNHANVTNGIFRVTYR